MNPFHDAAYNMAAVSATVALYRALIKKGGLAREEAVRILLDEAVAQVIQAEAHTQGTGVSILYLIRGPVGDRYLPC